jgi:microcystin degradation protein MlrC
MKVLIAALATETNTFSPIPTGRLSFETGMVTRTATQLPGNLFSAPLIEWRKAAEARGWEVVESLCALAQPAGVTLGDVYEGYRDEILSDLTEHRPDIFLVSLHGAMVAEGYEDCEGDLLARARNILGPEAIIGAELDPHCHLTRQMIDSATLLVMYKEYPHIDSPDRARELFELCVEAAEGRIRPVMAVRDCGMLTLVETMKPPADGFVRAMIEAESKDGVLSLSLAHGFAWGDVADVGMRMLAVVDGEQAKAQAVADRFAAAIWQIRDGLRMDYPDIETALDRVEAAEVTGAGPVVLADMADNAGAGAPGDASYVLSAVLERGLRDVALAVFWDPVLVGICKDAGVGARLTVRVGGKVCAQSGHPVDMDVIVRACRDGMTQMMGETEMEMGTGVWLEGTGAAEAVHLILSSTRTQCFNPSAFTDLGLNIAKMRALVVKSMNHFYAAFLPVASEIIHVSGPGVAMQDMTRIPLTKRDNDYWPRTEAPTASAAFSKAEKEMLQ